MKYWAHRLSKQTNKHAVKLTQLKLEIGLFGAMVAAPNDKVAIEITGTATKKGKPSSSSSSKPTTTPLSLLPFHGTPKGRCTHTTSNRRFLSSKAPSFVWDARDLCGFHLLLKDDSLVACDMAFHVLYGEGAAGESKPKMMVIGNVSMRVAMAELTGREEMKKTESNSQHLLRRLPIQLRVNGLFIEATLSVSLRLLKLRDSHNDSAGTFENSVQSEEKRGIIGSVKYLTSLTKKNNGKFERRETPSPYESDGSPVCDSDDSSNESTTSSGSSSSGRIHNAGSRLKNGSERFTSSETKTRLDTVQRSWSQLSWNRSSKGRSFETNTSQQEISTTHSGPFTKSDELSTQVYHEDKNCGASSWEVKELSSRDGQTKLKTNVFFASFDQRSQKASGESACTVLVALIAYWLHSNQNMPTRAQFDSLITQGSSEWRRLCNSDYYLNLFPDKHFDLETIIKAKLRPLTVLPEKSYVGFFSPEKFHCLKEAMSFDGIWDEINSKVAGYEPRIYIVSWNDHFFVLKVEADAYYIIDSLGERLFEGCQQAFILKFDESSLMYEIVDKANEASSKGNGGTRSAKSKDKSLEIVCRGKDCCKEFIKRFLAAIPLGQLEKEEKKGSVTNPYLHRQLQIDFHCSSTSSSSTTASSSSSSSSSVSSLLNGHL